MRQPSTLRRVAFLSLWVVLVSGAGPSRSHADDDPTGAVEVKTSLGLLSPPRLGSVEAIHERSAPAVVGLTCRRDAREVYYGTGVVIDPSGLVLTSVTVVPSRARDIRVYFAGGREARAELLDAVEETEVSLLRVRNVSRLLRGKEKGLPFLELGDSSDLRVGEPAFTLGNAFQSIQDDDKVTLAAGLVSGLYELTEKRFEATYVGPAIETSAALNSGMDGGPLLNADGEIVGLLSLNYSRHRWLGTAVPINEIKPIIARHRGWLDDRQESFRVYAGFELGERAGGDIRVLHVRPGSPAASAGLHKGDVIVGYGETKLSSLDELRERFAAAKPGDTMPLQVLRSGSATDVPILLWGKF